MKTPKCILCGRPAEFEGLYFRGKVVALYRLCNMHKPTKAILERVEDEIARLLKARKP